MRNFRKCISIIIIFSLIFEVISTSFVVFASSSENMDYSINISELTYSTSKTTESIKTYTTDDYETFVNDYKNNSLPEIYITEFLYDGIGQVQKVSLDDDTNEVEIKDISTTAININTTGNIELAGSAENTMIAINTNGVTGDINLYLNGINLTSSKNTPAIMIYNKDVSYNKCNVSINTVSGSENYISGGKLKKVSTMLTKNLTSYTSQSNNYSDTSNSYYYYFENEKDASDLSNLLYAEETADSEKVSEGNPYTYYKFSGAISSDIALTFEGEGYLEINSQGDEGIEVKGDLIFKGGTGDYKVTSYDDGLNASTTGTDISINVNSLFVNVLDEGESDSEGDGIDSNGTIHINGGTIYSFAHPTSQDDGIDSNSGTYINGGTVIAIGNMADEISNDSEQEFIKLNFKEQQSAGTLICITDTDKNPIMAFQSDRTFTTLTYSSPKLSQTTYYIYKNGTITGSNTNGLYDTIESYTLGTQQQWSTNNTSNNGAGEMPSNNPNGENNGETPPDKPDGEEGESSGETPPDKPDGNGGNTSDGTQNQPSATSTENTNSNSNISYSGSTEITEDSDITSGTYSSTTADENALLVSGDVDVNLSNITATKSGNSSGGDNCNFYGINSAILARLGAKLSITNAKISTTATGANGVFSYGGSATTNNSSNDGTTVTISDSEITTTGDNSGGIMTTGGGTTVASNLTVTTSGTSSAAIRTDRGGGTVTVDGGTYTTSGQGSPTIYSTADVTVKNATLVATASEGIVIEGKNSVTIENCDLTDSNTKLNGQSTTYKNIFLYQSVSGDAAEGTSTFTSTDSNIVTNNGDTFYITNTSAVINLTNNTITNNDKTGNLLRAQADSWGNSGSNGGSVVLNATNQDLNGTISIDNISSLNMNLKSNSTYTGTINAENTAKYISITLDESSTMELSGDSYITSLSDSDSTFSNIKFNGHTLYVNGKAYTSSEELAAADSSDLVVEQEADTTTNNSNNGNMANMPNDANGNQNSDGTTSIEFTLSSSSHSFNNVCDYTGNTDENSTNADTNSDEDSSIASTILPQTGSKINFVIIFLIAGAIIFAVVFCKKYKKLNFK